jgi:FdrA protein
VYRETADAVLYAGEWLRPAVSYEYPPLPLADFGGDLAAVNVGLESFYDSLRSQGASVIQVDWRPPAGGNEQLMAILAKMRAKR